MLGLRDVGVEEAPRSFRPGSAYPRAVDEEQTFRTWLDERGVLVPGLEPDVPCPYLVFAQRPDARLDATALRQHAARFFQAKLGLTVDKTYRGAVVRDAARIVLATDDPSTSGTRLCFARPVEPQEHDRAEEAERVSHATGMGLLARRCPTVWLIARSFAPTRPASSRDPDINTGIAEDRVALLLAAIFASVLLGPILDGDAIFGVRTARLKLERPAAPPYR